MNSKELAKHLDVSNGRISHLVNGRKVTRNGKVEWNEPPKLEEGKDYSRTKNGLIFTPQGIENIKTLLKIT